METEHAATPATSPLPSRLSWLCALLVAVVALVLYSLTAAPDLALVDSAELALAAYTGGVAHPPGVPLYVLIGHAFANLPWWDSPARALNLMSALWGALAVGLAFLVTERSIALLEISGLRGPAETKGAPSTVLLPALAAALTWTTSRNLWFWSGLTEVYTLGLFLMAAAWLCTLLWACRQIADEDAADLPLSKQKTTPRLTEHGTPWLLAAIALAGLGLANHHATALLIFPPLLMLVLLVNRRVLTNARFLGASAGILTTTLALYAWLPVAARHERGLGWGGIDSFGALVRHVAGWQYRAQVSGEGHAAGAVVADFARSLVLDCGIVATAAIVAGCLAAVLINNLTKGKDHRPEPLSRKERRVRARKASKEAAPAERSNPWRLAVGAGVPLVMVLFNLLLVAIYGVGLEDRTSYQLPAQLAWCVLAGTGLWLAGRSWNPLRTPAVLIVVVVASAGLNAWRNFEFCDLHEERSARLLVTETLDSLPAGSLVFTTEWNFYAPYLYMRHVEGYRPDIDVVDVLLMRRFWYPRYVERAMPELTASARVAFDAFHEQVRRFDRGEQYSDEEIAQAYTTLMTEWTRNRLAESQVFADFGCLDHPQEKEWIRSFGAMPRGLLVRLEERGVLLGEAGTPVPPKQITNLEYLRRRIGSGETPLVNPLLIDPTEIRYWKVYRAYLDAVESSLLLAALSAGEDTVAEWAAGYHAWFPDTDFALRRAIERKNRVREP